MNTTNPNHRKMEWLETMRGFAAIWVLLHHAKQSVDHFVGDMGARPMLANGYLGVDFFFVLSGFIIAFASQALLPESNRIVVALGAASCAIYKARNLMLPGLTVHLLPGAGPLPGDIPFKAFHIAGQLNRIRDEARALAPQLGLEQEPQCLIVCGGPCLRQRPRCATAVPGTQAVVCADALP